MWEKFQAIEDHFTVFSLFKMFPISRHHCPKSSQYLTWRFWSQTILGIGNELKHSYISINFQLTLTFWIRKENETPFPQFHILPIYPRPYPTFGNVYDSALISTLLDGQDKVKSFLTRTDQPLDINSDKPAEFLSLDSRTLKKHFVILPTSLLNILKGYRYLKRLQAETN